jgi:hypothetical protein
MRGQHVSVDQRPRERLAQRALDEPFGAPHRLGIARHEIDVGVSHRSENRRGAHA